MARTDWKQVMPKIADALDFFTRQNIKPNLRTLYYRLVSMNAIPNTKNAYKGLSRKMVEARKNGTFRWDCIEDRARQTYGDLSDRRFNRNRADMYENELAQKLKDLSVDTLLKEYMDWLRPRINATFWMEQPEVCEIWIEKEALTTTLESFTNGLGIKIRPNRGYSSWTFLKEAVDELRDTLDMHDHVHIIYLGDLDPSGLDIDRYIKEVFEYFGLDYSKITFKRICVTVEQVEKFDLPPRPDDAETLAKLQRDPRTANYTLDYIVELDALLAFVPDQFRAIVRNEISAIHDAKLHWKLKNEARELQATVDAIHNDYKDKMREKMLSELI